MTNTYHLLTYWIGTLVFITSSIIPVQGQNDVESVRRQIDRIIHYDTEIPLHDHHGFIIGIVDGQSTYVLDYPGSDGLPINVHDRFELGGLSQVFTGQYLVELSRQGILNLDDPIYPQAGHLPESWRKLTWRQCLQHVSGLPRVIPGISGEQSIENPYGSIHIEDLKAILPQVAFDTLHFRYSVHNYALIQDGLQRRFEQPVSRQLDSAFNQWNLKETTILTPSKPTAISVGYRKNGLVASPWITDSYQAGLGVVSSLSDLIEYSKWLILHAEDATYSELFYPSQPTDLRGRIAMAGSWYVFMPDRRQWIYSHAGQKGGHRSYIGFVPATRTAVIILAKSPDETNDLGLLILRMINDNWKRNRTDEEKY